MQTITLSEKNFDEEVTNYKGKVLVDFWAQWCTPCKMLSPLVDSVADETEKVKICKVNVEQNTELAKRFSVMSIPTLIVFEDGQVINQSVGLISKEEIIALIR